MSTRSCRQFTIEKPHAVRFDDNGEMIFMEEEIMEHKIGRKLRANEYVRHKNGDTLDNRNDNLELCVDMAIRV